MGYALVCMYDISQQIPLISVLNPASNLIRNLEYPALLAYHFKIVSQRGGNPWKPTVLIIKKKALLVRVFHLYHMSCVIIQTLRMFNHIRKRKKAPFLIYFKCKSCSPFALVYPLFSFPFKENGVPRDCIHMNMTILWCIPVNAAFKWKCPSLSHDWDI